MPFFDDTTFADSTYKNINHQRFLTALLHKDLVAHQVISLPLFENIEVLASKFANILRTTLPAPVRFNIFPSNLKKSEQYFRILISFHFLLSFIFKELRVGVRSP